VGALRGSHCGLGGHDYRCGQIQRDAEATMRVIDVHFAGMNEAESSVTYYVTLDL
jgi:hypothetical protein